MDINHVKAGAKMITEGLAMLNKGPLDYTLTKLSLAYDVLMNVYAPFKINDRVVLVNTPKMVQDHLHGCRHFIIAGACGTVAETDLLPSGEIVYMVIFDDESWINLSGHIESVPLMSRHSFMMKECDLEKIRSV
jgi:hypothetical protein